MNYLLRANHNLLLPDGKTTIKVGDTFEWTGDIGIFGTCIDIIKKIEEKKSSEKVEEMTSTQIRALAKEMKIPNYSRESVEVLAQKIAEASKDASQKNDPENKDPESQADEQTENKEDNNAGE